MKNFDSNLFCERAKELFGKTGQQELSQKIGISQAIISVIKNNFAKSPSADTVYLISKSFGVSSDWLLGLTDVKYINTTAENAYNAGLKAGYKSAKNQIMEFIMEMR